MGERSWPATPPVGPPGGQPVPQDSSNTPELRPNAEPHPHPPPVPAPAAVDPPASEPADDKSAAAGPPEPAASTENPDEQYERLHGRAPFAAPRATSFASRKEAARAAAATRLSPPTKCPLIRKASPGESPKTRHRSRRAVPSPALRSLSVRCDEVAPPTRVPAQAALRSAQGQCRTAQPASRSSATTRPAAGSAAALAVQTRERKSKRSRH